MKNPISVSAFYDWLSRQDPARSYDFRSNTNCLCAQYMKAMGFPLVFIGAYSWYDGRGGEYYFPKILTDIALGASALCTEINRPDLDHVWTFEAATERARLWLEKEKSRHGVL
jgi:hypothetical protein